MLCCKRTGIALVSGLLALSGSAVSLANPLVVGLGVEADNADNRAFSLFADLGLTDDTWLSGSVSRTDSERELFDLATTYADLSVDHHFKPIGVRLQAAYWGDDDLLESRNLSASLYWKNDRGSIALDVLRRDFDLTIGGGGVLPNPIRASFEADGFGLSASLALSDDVRLYTNGMDFHYSRNLRLQPNIDSARLRFFSLSRLSIVNSLVDYRASVGIERQFGSRSLDFRFARWRTQLDRGDVNSYGIGFLTPTGGSADMEFRLAYDDSENFGGAVVFSVFLYLFDE